MRKITTLFILMTLLFIAFPPDLLAPPLFRGRTEKQMAARVGVYPAEYFNVDDSDTNGIQEAIDAAYAAGGGEVWLSAEAYTLEDGVAMKANVTLVGTGWGTILQSDSATIRKISHLNIGGDSDPASSIPIGTSVIQLLTAASASDYSVGDVVWINDSSVTNEIHSYYIVESMDGGSGSVVLESETFIAYTETPYLNRRTPATKDTIIRNIYFKNVYINVDAVPNVKIDNCRFDDSGDNFVIGIGTSYMATITNNYFSGVGTLPIDIEKSQGVIIKNNVMDATVVGGIKIEDSARCIIQGNDIQGNESGFGIEIDASAFNIVKGNIIDSTADDELNLNSYSDSNIIIGNIIPYGTIDNDGAGNRGSGNIYSTCEGCDEPSSW
jgi:parallel beta-helix repeat protein